MSLRFYLSLLSVAVATALPRSETERSESTELKWTPCNLEELFPEEAVRSSVVNPLECSAIEVPLDYTDPHSKPLKLDLVKVKGSKQPSKGSVLFNPGGPGPSGIDIGAGTIGKSLLDSLGGEYDLIAFDTRGVGRTIPFKCDIVDLPQPKLSRRANYTVTIPSVDGYEIVKRDWDWYDEQAQACYEANKETGHLLSTPFVARDMLKIVDALNEGGKLRFWGVSYGTVIGQTFASMFPDRVERIVLDSVQTFREHYTGYWLFNTRDTDKALTEFFQQCIDAGPEKCELADYCGKDTTPQKITAALADALEKHNTDAATAEDVRALKALLVTTLYTPLSMLQATVYVQLALQGNWTTVREIVAEQSPFIGEETPATWGITCSDSNLRKQSPEELYPLVKGAEAHGMFSEGSSSVNWLCSRWKFDAAERPESAFSAVNTSNPLLFVNGLYDPVTPVTNAYEAALGYSGSGLLVHKGFGHGTTSQPSKCISGVVRAYFDTGALPDVGTVCEPDIKAYEQGLAEASAVAEAAAKETSA